MLGDNNPRSRAVPHMDIAECYCCGRVARGFWRSGHWNDRDDCHADPSCQKDARIGCKYRKRLTIKEMLAHK